MPASNRSKSKTSHHETHYMGRSSWIRAGVLGANDGVVSIAALVMALVASQSLDTKTFVLTILSALVAGAASMAIGEYVSVASQKDIESADIAKEKKELVEEPEDELAELTAIYKNRGLSPDLAHSVAVELTEHNALQAHLRDELGIVEEIRAQPIQASYVSFIAFSLGGLLPFGVGSITYTALKEDLLFQLSLIGLATLIALTLLGFLGAKLGGAPRAKLMQLVLLDQSS